MLAKQYFTCCLPVACLSLTTSAHGTGRNFRRVHLLMREVDAHIKAWAAPLSGR